MSSVRTFLLYIHTLKTSPISTGAATAQELHNERSAHYVVLICVPSPFHPRCRPLRHSTSTQPHIHRRPTAHKTETSPQCYVQQDAAICMATSCTTSCYSGTSFVGLFLFNMLISPSTRALYCNRHCTRTTCARYVVFVRALSPSRTRRRHLPLPAPLLSPLPLHIKSLHPQ
jgi:hypothetical protein